MKAKMWRRDRGDRRGCRRAVEAWMSALVPLCGTFCWGGDGSLISLSDVGQVATQPIPADGNTG
ncbi:MAG: hypothetical protein QXN56_06460, partial [Candidatus Hadarchaeum sp.]